MKKFIAILMSFAFLAFCFPVNAVSAIVVNRAKAEFGDTLGPATTLKKRMNCYGYAIQVYSLMEDNNQADHGYRQQPGEFKHDQQTFAQLQSAIITALSGNSSTALSFFQTKIFADFNELNGSGIDSEWVIQECTANASIPYGYRKIALVLKLGTGYDKDFHFYMRHSNGVWSHKRGSAVPSTQSIDTNVTITDSNFTSKIIEGGYNDGTRYYLIKKSCIADYPHRYGHDSDSLFTITDFKDRSGDRITLSRVVTGGSNSANFDYAGDVDYYSFTPTTSSSYRFDTSLPASYDVDMTIYDTYGNIIASDLSVGAPLIILNLVSGNRYFIRVRCITDAVVGYKLYHYNTEV